MLLNAFCVVRSRVMSHGRKTGTTAIVPLCTATDLPPNGLYRFVSTKIRASLMSNTPQSDDLSNASVAYDTKESAYFASDFDEEVIDVDKELEQEVNNRRQLLKATLKHVPTLGWTAHAIVSGAKDLGLSPSSIGLFEGGTLGLVAEYIRYNNEKLEQAAKSIKLSGSTRDKYYSLIKARLELQVPYMSNWQQGLGHLVCPSNIKVSAPLLLETADSICYSAGDRSSDMSWYTKRGEVSAIYASTELYMLTDQSSGYQDTWKFLNRRLDDRAQLAENYNQLSLGFDPAQKVIQSLLDSVVKLNRN
eukprot:TRINITY_DN3880_c0_g1_i2.p1 TRINITY_DN3880_c0_g1~~TRINITY_DN3880_c0_g1_i2.p1  ORF type:complete len:305 (-),score=67.97 TRINITY_DN3880_c0_g1_i2:90-1004(-)